MTIQRMGAIILAAGQGTRMKSATPKVLHELCGRPMIHYVVRAAIQAGAEEVVVVVGHGREQVEASLTRDFGDRVRMAVQSEQRGTGHATMCGLPELSSKVDAVMVLCGDTPLLESASLLRLKDAWLASADSPMGMLTCELADPTGYGRVLRDEKLHVIGIREHKDCSPMELAIREVNPGVFVFRTSFLADALPKLTPQNAQKELYLTDVVALAVQAKGVVAAVSADAETLNGINDRAQLFRLEERMAQGLANRARLAGVTVRAGVQIDDGVELGQDAIIEANVVLRGKTRIGAGARIDVGAVLTDASIEAGAYVKPYSIITSSIVGEKAQIGPFSHLRPGSEIGADAHVGNFVETKNTTLRRGAKANHLAYLGDGDVGEEANVGAGTIFCNYDGFRKHRTIIGARAFIGSDSQLVAPITIGEGAYVGTGTTVTKDVPADALAISRTPQVNKDGYASRLRGRLKAASDASKK